MKKIIRVVRLDSWVNQEHPFKYILFVGEHSFTFWSRHNSGDFYHNYWKNCEMETLTKHLNGKEVSLHEMISNVSDWPGIANLPYEN